MNGISLKAFSVEMASHLGLTPLAVYERQRALVRLRMLPSTEERGPNSAVRATPHTVSRLLIAALAADNLSEIDRIARTLINAKTSETERRLDNHAKLQAHLKSASRQARQFKNLGMQLTVPATSPPKTLSCPITGAATFAEALENI